MCVAVVGSGKTASFLVPVLSQIYRNGPGEAPPDSVSAINTQIVHALQAENMFNLLLHMLVMSELKKV